MLRTIWTSVSARPLPHFLLFPYTGCSAALCQLPSELFCCWEINVVDYWSLETDFLEATEWNVTGVRPRADDPLQVLSAGPVSLPSASHACPNQSLMWKECPTGGMAFHTKQSSTMGKAGTCVRATKCSLSAWSVVLDSHQWARQCQGSRSYNSQWWGPGQKLIYKPGQVVTIPSEKKMLLECAHLRKLAPQ